MKNVLIKEIREELEDAKPKGFEETDCSRGYQSSPMFESTGNRQAVDSRNWRKEWRDDRD